jgi:hypothetical protein
MPETYCICNIKKGNNHRTLIDCYSLVNGKHWINGNQDTRTDSWTGWKLQPGDADKTKLDGIESGAKKNVQSDWNVTNTSSDAYIKNKPTIPTVNNGTLTIQKNGTTVATFTANQSTGATANITVPTGAAADKGVDTSISTGSTSTNLPTSKAVAAFVEGKGYKTTDNNSYHTTGSWSGLTYTATANGGADELKLTIPTGTSSTTVAKGDHTHSGYVSTSRTINGKALSSNITLNTDDLDGGTSAIWTLSCGNATELID